MVAEQLFKPLFIALLASSAAAAPVQAQPLPDELRILVTVSEPSAADLAAIYQLETVLADAGAHVHVTYQYMPEAMAEIQRAESEEEGDRMIIMDQCPRIIVGFVNDMPPVDGEVDIACLIGGTERVPIPITATNLNLP